MFKIIQKLKGINLDDDKPIHSEREIVNGVLFKSKLPDGTTLIWKDDPIDKMVEKEMAQLKSIKDEKEKEKMSEYKKRITSLEELHQVIDALETLNKKYVITKRIEVIHLKVANQKYPSTIWYVEEVE